MLIYMHCPAVLEYKFQIRSKKWVILIGHLCRILFNNYLPQIGFN